VLEIPDDEVGVRTVKPADSPAADLISPWSAVQFRPLLPISHIEGGPPGRLRSFPSHDPRAREPRRRRSWDDLGATVVAGDAAQNRVPYSRRVVNVRPRIIKAVEKRGDVGTPEQLTTRYLREPSRRSFGTMCSIPSMPRRGDNSPPAASTRARHVAQGGTFARIISATEPALMNGAAEIRLRSVGIDKPHSVLASSHDSDPGMACIGGSQPHAEVRRPLGGGLRVGHPATPTRDLSPPNLAAVDNLAVVPLGVAFE
jgi:hypothetical protein